jgi:hypothetical protein
VRRITRAFFSELARLWRGSILIIARISADLRSLACCRIRLEKARSRILHGRQIERLRGLRPCGFFRDVEDDLAPAACARAQLLGRLAAA